jgi:predicted signal transduction protein with EAL and GGDEF domain
MNIEVLQGIAEVFVVAIPLVIVSAGGLLLLSRSRLGDAIVRRIGGPSQHSEWEEQLDAVNEELAGVRQHLSEMQERIDFAERLLVRVGAPRRGLPEGE